MGKDKNLTLIELTEEERNKALECYRIIKPFIEDNVPLIRIAEESSKSYITLCRWVKQYKEYGLSGLAKKRRADSGKHRKITDEIKLFIEGLALTKPQLSTAAIYRKVVNLSNKNNWYTPGYKTVYNIIKNVDPALITLAHGGSKAYRDKYDLLYNRKSDYPNEIWQADHSLMDIWLIDDNGKHKRPWLTIIIDDFSRTIAGYFLTFQNPCVQNTCLALRRAIWYKSDPKWHVCGIPDTFYTDHGSDFTSIHLEQVSADIKMKLVFSLPGVPRGRGIIERFFETLNQLFLCDLPGYMPQGQYPEKPPTMKIEELDMLLKEFLVENYNYRVHSEIKEPPQNRWEKGGFIPRLPESLEQLDLLLLNEAKPRKIHPDGIHFQNLKYIDPTLAAYVGEEVIVRYDPRDMAEIRVFHNNTFLCRAICQQLSGKEINLKDIIKARNKRRKELKQEIKNRKEIVDLLLESQESLINETNNNVINEEKNEPKRSNLKRYHNE